MSELSPAARKVLDAFNREARPEPHHQREAIAAALRAVADTKAEVVIYDCFVRTIVDVDDIYAIANELETQP